MGEQAARREARRSRSIWAAPVLLGVAMALASCGDMGRLQTAAPSVSPLKPNRTVTQTPAAEREHERILASYGGGYADPKLEALIGKTVDRLVAASDRPDQAYKVTILNSGAVERVRASHGPALCDQGVDCAGQRHLRTVLGVIA